MSCRIPIVLFVVVSIASACRPSRTQELTSYEPHPLPSLVTGANVRPVGDVRRGYGSLKARETLLRLKKMGVNTIAILMEGHMNDLEDVDIRFKEGEALDSIEAILRDANQMGFSTILIPHLYIEDGSWRGLIKMPQAKARDAWWTSYSRFISAAADIASRSGTSVLSLGVELKGMSAQLDTRTRMRELKHHIQKRFSGQLTYSANWDEAEQVVFWDLFDVVGVNGYYPLVPDVIRGAEMVGRRLANLHRLTQKDVLVLEVGYRAGPMSHVQPWAWPEDVKNREVDEEAQARNWAAILAHWLDVPGVRGLLVWVIPTDPDDPASEPPHGFSPMNKVAEEVLKRAFSSYGLKAG
jgi:hypothetical protein